MRRAGGPTGGVPGVAAAWAAYEPERKWTVTGTSESPDEDGWSKIRQYGYQTSPNERRAVAAIALFAGEAWTVIVIDRDAAVAEKRASLSTASR
jgi:hypothetical protein